MNDQIRTKTDQKKYYENELNKLEEELNTYDDPHKKINVIKYYICQHDLKKHLPLLENIIIHPHGRPITSSIKDKFPEHTHEELRIEMHKTIEYYFQDFKKSFWAFDSQCQISEHWRKDYNKKRYLYEFFRSLFIKIEKIEQIELINPLKTFFRDIGCIQEKETELIDYLEILKESKFLLYDDINLVNETNKITVLGDANINILAIFEILESSGIIQNITGNYTGKGPIKKHLERIMKYFQKKDGIDFPRESLISMRTNKKYLTNNERFNVTKTNLPPIKKLVK